jgi:hypothetical protein
MDFVSARGNRAMRQDLARRPSGLNPPITLRTAPLDAAFGVKTL